MPAPSQAAPAQPDEIGTDTRTWVDVIRRARLTPTVKLVGLTIATYADPDGRRVYPGLARLVYQCGIGYSTARRALADLKSGGLLELVRRGNRRRRQADEYRLILAGDLLDRVDVPSPEDERTCIEKINREVTGSGRVRQRRLTLTERSAKPASRSVDNPPGDDHHEPVINAHLVSDRTRSNAHRGPTLALAPARPPIHKSPTHKRDQPSALAGNHRSASTTAPNGHQLPLVAILSAVAREPIPIDPDQLDLIEPETQIDPAREALWPVIADQLTRINTRATKEPA